MDRLSNLALRCFEHMVRAQRGAQPLCAARPKARALVLWPLDAPTTSARPQFGSGHELVAYNNYNHVRQIHVDLPLRSGALADSC